MNAATTGHVRTAERRWSFGSAVLDERSLELHVAGRLVEIERKPLEVLQYLLRRANEVVTRDDLAAVVWPGRIVSDTVVAKSIGKLRDAIGDDDQAIIKTVHGYGYRLVAPVRSEAPASAAPAAPLRILLIEDHELFRSGLKLLLTELADEIEFGEAVSCEAALALARGRAFGVVLLDYHLPGRQGRDALRAVRTALPEATIVVLSGLDDPAAIRQIVEDGAAGFIPKSSSHPVMLAALRLVLAGGSYVPPEALLAAPGPPVTAEPGGALDDLTQRQLAILRLALQGKASDVIARELRLPEARVRDQLEACFRALGVTNRADAVFAAARAGLVG